MSAPTVQPELKAATVRRAGRALAITVCDVGPRDGLQNEATCLPAAMRAELVNRLAETGLQRVEAASFVNPARVPQMAGAEDVVAGIAHRAGVLYAGLILNERGYDRLAASRLDEAHYAFASTETFNQRNSNTSVEASVLAAEAIIARAHADDVRVTITIATSFGCPFEGSVDAGWILELASRLSGAAPNEIVFADTNGVAVPTQVGRLVAKAVTLGLPIGVHLHNTRNTGFANAYAALEAGATVFDASIGGIGGCPFAPRATGNIATEDLIYMFNGEGIDTGLDLEKLISVAKWLEDILGRQLPGQVYRVSSGTAQR